MFFTSNQHKNMKFDSVGKAVQILDEQQIDVDAAIKEITDTGLQDEAFYVCNIGDMLNKYKNWRQILPRVDTFYAVKCNDHPIVLETLAALGCGFDCASDVEIRKILSLGVSQNRIIFANPTKPISHIRYAARVGVSLMTFDNEMELYKIKDNYPQANLVLRIKCDDIHAKYVFGKKFGCDPDSEAPELLKLARALNLNIVGVSFHIGSASQNPNIYSEAIKAARHVFDLGISLGYQMRLLDIGGGFPGELGTDIVQIGNVINNAIYQYFPSDGVKIIAEPGRYYVSSAFYLAANIHSQKRVEQVNHLGERHTIQMYYINVGVYGALISILCDEEYYLHPLKVNENATYYESIVWGPTCDSLDKVTEKVVLPEMKIGDWVVIENAGAYTWSISSEFNGFPIPKVHCIIDRESYLTLKELTSNNDLLSVFKCENENDPLNSTNSYIAVEAL